MSSTFVFKHIKSSWGIYIKLTAELTTVSRVNSPLFQITDSVSLCVENPLTNCEGQTLSLTETDIEWLRRGVALVAKNITTTSPSQVVVRLLKITFSLCDFQAEGLACAIAGWVAQELKFEPPIIQIHFDKPQNRYVFNFSNEQTHP